MEIMAENNSDPRGLQMGIEEAMRLAIDEWQASVEERLAKDPARLALLAVFAMSHPGGDSVTANEMLARAGISYRIEPFDSIPKTIKNILAEADAKAITWKAEAHQVEVGTSRYDADPVESEE